MALETEALTLRIDGVTTISVQEEPEADPVSGGYVRRIEFYTDPVDSSNRRPVLTVMSYGEQAGVMIITPELTF